MAFKKNNVTNEELLAARAEGLNDAQVGKRFGITGTTVANRIGKRSPEEVLATHREAGKRTGSRKRVKAETKPVKAKEPTPAPPVVKEEPKTEEKVVEKPQKWPQAIPTDMFEFAICGNWGEKLAKLAEMAYPEKWRFTNPVSPSKFPEYQILEIYILRTFALRAFSYCVSPDEEAKKHFLITTEFACFHTGLYSRDLRDIYAYFEPSTTQGEKDWFLVGFVAGTHGKIQRIRNLPENMLVEREPFHPEYEIRVNLSHVLTSPERLLRLPESIRGAWNLALLIETAAEQSRRMAVMDKHLVVDGTAVGKLSKLLPLYLTGPEKPDAVMFLEEMDGFYLGSTILTLEQAYFDARVTGRVSIYWLRRLVEE